MYHPQQPLAKKPIKKLIKKPASEAHFNAIRRKLLTISIISFAVTFVSLAIVGLRLFYPFHTIIGVGLYTLSFIPMFRRIYLSRKTWKHYRSYRYSEAFFKKEKHRLLVAVIFILLSIGFLYLRPLDHKPFEGYSDRELGRLIEEDLYQSITAMDYLETTGNKLLNTIEEKESDANTSHELTALFEDFLNAVAFSETLTDKHRYFSSIPQHLSEERMHSFLISYSLYTKKYELVHRLIQSVSGNEYQKKVLNQYIPIMKRSGIYNEMSARFYAPKTRLRLSGGRLYLELFAKERMNAGDSVAFLHREAEASYDYLFSHFFTTLTRSGEIFVDTTEQKMFETWFPIQKAVANAMGRTILSERGKEGLINPEHALAMGEELAPGDIMLQRRNWHLSNVGIPGFWTHAALYTGSLDDMDQYFQSEFPYQDFATMSDYMRSRYPAVYAQYKSKDAEGYEKEVIEAIEPGVIIQSLVRSADADFVVALRPKNLSKKDIMQSVFKAFHHVGKPYDYDFDFDTLSALVCSELIYDSYHERLPEKAGIHFETSTINGRKMVSPLDIAKKFAHEHGSDEAELSFVYFLRSSEHTGEVIQADETTFLESVEWSKFSFLQTE